jgi:hypothetical protein
MQEKVIIILINVPVRGVVMARSKLSIFAELLGLDGINGKRKKSKKTTNKWLRQQIKSEAAKEMVKDMAGSNPIIQAAIVRAITGIPVDPKDIVNIDPVKRMEDVLTRQILFEINQDDEQKEQIKQGLFKKWYRDSNIHKHVAYNEMGEFSQMMPGQMPDYGFDPYNPLSMFDAVKERPDGGD